MPKKPSYLKDDLTDRQWLDKCYNYLRYDLLGYEEGEVLPRFIVQRMKGITEGQYIHNKKQHSYGGYYYDVILATMMVCKQDIKNAIRRKHFDTETDKMKYIMAIIERNINTVYARMKNKREQNEKIKNLDMSQAHHVGADYQRKTKEKSNKFNDLW